MGYQDVQLIFAFPEPACNEPVFHRIKTRCSVGESSPKTCFCRKIRPKLLGVNMTGQSICQSIRRVLIRLGARLRHKRLNPP
jgi:hypothetical protein